MDREGLLERLGLEEAEAPRGELDGGALEPGDVWSPAGESAETRNRPLLLSVVASADLVSAGLEQLCEPLVRRLVDDCRALAGSGDPRVREVSGASRLLSVGQQRLVGRGLSLACPRAVGVPVDPQVFGRGQASLSPADERQTLARLSVAGAVDGGREGGFWRGGFSSRVQEFGRLGGEVEERPGRVACSRSVIEVERLDRGRGRDFDSLEGRGAGEGLFSFGREELAGIVPLRRADRSCVSADGQTVFGQTAVVLQEVESAVGPGRDDGPLCGGLLEGLQAVQARSRSCALLASVDGCEVSRGTGRYRGLAQACCVAVGRRAAVFPRSDQGGRGDPETRLHSFSPQLGVGDRYLDALIHLDLVLAEVGAGRLSSDAFF